MIYLNTHIVVWLCTGSAKKLSRKILNLIEKTELVLILPMTLIEPRFLSEIGRVKLPAFEFLEHSRSEFGLKVCQRAFEHVALAACSQSWTRDPFDRVIAAHAFLAKAPLVSHDRNILENFKLALH